VTALPPDSIIGTLGSEFSFHDILRRKIYSHLSVRYFNEFENIFDAVSNGEIDYGLIALSNTIHGSVDDNQRKIAELNLVILETHDLPISLHLAAKSSLDPHQIEKIYAHPVAMNECQAFFKDLKVIHIPSKSNSHALIDLKLSDGENNAAISGREAIKNLEVILISESIHDSEPNITTFGLVSKK